MADTEFLCCWKCGASLVDLPLPLGRADDCPSCRADLHVCLLCEFYATGIANDCREPIAEPVQNKRRANFCGYFKPRPGACSAAAPRIDAKDRLEQLFGLAGDAKPSDPRDPQAAADALQQLFGLSARKPEDGH